MDSPDSLSLAKQVMITDCKNIPGLSSPKCAIQSFFSILAIQPPYTRFVFWNYFRISAAFIVTSLIGLSSPNLHVLNHSQASVPSHLAVSTSCVPLALPWLALCCQGGAVAWPFPFILGQGATHFEIHHDYPAKNTDCGYPAKSTNYGYPAKNKNYGYPAKNTNYGYPAKNTNYGYPAKNTKLWLSRQKHKTMAIQQKKKNNLLQGLSSPD